ncbi:MAG: GT2 family glycosyltransferase [Cellvibrionaceae bacterium]|jgi:GT2 family glycosyltransferase
MKLAAIILNFRTPDMTVDAIKSTIAALVDVDFEWSITIVDNDSGDASEEKLRAVCLDNQRSKVDGWSRVDVLQSGNNGGFGAGNNVGIRHVMMQHKNLEYLYVLNSDAFPEREALTTLVYFLDNNKNYGVAGSYIFGTDGEPHITAFRFPTIQGEFEGAIKLGPVSRLLNKYIVPIGIPETSIDVDWLAGASMLVRVETIHQVGLFDETFFLYFEETDFLLRMAKQGWKTRYLLESKVAHVGSASTGMKQWERIPSYWLDSRRHYFTKNHGKMYFYLATLAKILGIGIWRLRCKITSKTDQEPQKFSFDIIRHLFN